MKLKIELTYWNGILDPTDNTPEPDPDYQLVDSDTGKVLSDCEFTTYEELEAHISARYPGCERWVPPLASPEEVAKLVRILDMLDAGIKLDPLMIRRLLIRETCQCGFPDDIAGRIKTTLARFLFAPNGAAG